MSTADALFGDDDDDVFALDRAVTEPLVASEPAPSPPSSPTPSSPPAPLHTSPSLPLEVEPRRRLSPPDSLFLEKQHDEGDIAPDQPVAESSPLPSPPSPAPSPPRFTSPPPAVEPERPATPPVALFEAEDDDVFALGQPTDELEVPIAEPERFSAPAPSSPPPSSPPPASEPAQQPSPPEALFDAEDDEIFSLGESVDKGEASVVEPEPSPPPTTPMSPPPSPPPTIQPEPQTAAPKPYKTSNPWASAAPAAVPPRPTSNPWASVAPTRPTVNPWATAPPFRPASPYALVPTPPPPPPPISTPPPPPPRKTPPPPPQPLPLSTPATALLKSTPPPPPPLPLPTPPPPPLYKTPPPPPPSLPTPGLSPSSVSPRAPVISFGFGGKLLVVYPALGMPIGGLARGEEGDGGTVRVMNVSEVLSPASLSSSSEVFPGPLFLDPSCPKGAAGAKGKKAAVLQYLDARASETEHALGWLKTQGVEGATRYREEEGKGVLLRLIGVMVENEGRLLGSAKVEGEVRSALLPDLIAPARLSRATSSTAPASLHSSSPPTQTASLHMSRASLDSTIGPSASGAALDQLSYLLLQGEKKEAAKYAVQQQLWSHALLLASTLDKQTWADVVKAFAAAELGSSSDGMSSRKARPALRQTYEMFGGSAGAGGSFLDPLHGHGRPGTVDGLDDWREVAAMLSANRGAGDKEALLSLGDSLVSVGWLHSGHACYLLSSHPPPLDPVGGPVAPRVHLYGASLSSRPSQLHDAIILTELVEFALSLAPIVKGQEPFTGLPSLQAYRLVHATRLAELGDTITAQRYCEAIAASLKATKVPSQCHTLAFINQLRELSERISGTGAVDKSGSWISRTVAKPSLDSLGSWFEGRITKFVAGEGEDSASMPVAPTTNPSLSVGPFSHYAPVSASASSSTWGAAPVAAAEGEYRPASAPAWGASNAYSQYAPEAAAPAWGVSDAYSHYAPAPAAPAWGSNASYGNDNDNLDLGNPQTATLSAAAEEPKPVAAAWGASYGDEDDDLGLGNSRPSPAATLAEEAKPAVTAAWGSNPSYANDDADDDLGLGNSRPARAATTSSTKTEKPKPAEPQDNKPAVKEEVKPSGSWLGKLWGGGGGKKEPTPPATPGAPGAPIKAKLGEESAFYFDKDLKKWVNKKAGPEAATPPPPPPPPSRAPSRAPLGGPPPKPADNTPPPPPPPPVRAVTTDPVEALLASGPLSRPPLGGPPPKPADGTPPPPVRAKTADPLEALLASGPPSRGPTPTGSAAARKKNLRSRYVDVLEQS